MNRHEKADTSTARIPHQTSQPAADPTLAAVLGLVSLLLASLPLSVSADEAVPPVRSRPNIVLIVSDDHGIDALGCYGNPRVDTPSLDALAADGIRFTHAFCTTPSCSPSRSVILTGLQNHRNGAYGLAHQEHHFQTFDVVNSLPVRLAEHGYRTARVGKFHVAPQSVYRFESVLSAGEANDPDAIGRSPIEMADLVRPVLASPDPRPLFLYFATDDPHRSNIVLPDGSPSFVTYPDPNPFGNRPAGYPGVTPRRYASGEVIVPAYLPDNSDTRAELAQYYQSVNRLDQGIGRLIQILKETGRYENTLIIYLSDNGAAFPGAKNNLYEPGIRLPLIARIPGRRNPGAVQDALVSWADITPTILAFAGVSAPDGELDGRSFHAGLDGGRLDGWDEVFASHTFHQVTMYFPMRAVRTRRYKLIFNLASNLSFPMSRDLVSSPTWLGPKLAGATTFGVRTVSAFLQRPKFELYDLEADPDEVVNLADVPDLQAVKNELIGRIQEFQQQTKDPWYHKWVYE